MVDFGDLNLKKITANLKPSIEEGYGGVITEAPTHSTPAFEPAALITGDPTTTVAKTALQIIQSYSVNENTDNQTFSSMFLPIVIDHVKEKIPIKMVLPAFPAKSPNRVDKVLGPLPDLGEELALAHLNGMCRTIAEFYGPGAEVFIASDGVVYSGMPSVHGILRVPS